MNLILHLVLMDGTSPVTHQNRASIIHCINRLEHHMIAVARQPNLDHILSH
jgi:hypothetical protein